MIWFPLPCPTAVKALRQKYGLTRSCAAIQTVRDHGFNTNLGKAASQDDMSLQAIIPWDPKDAA